MLTAAVGSLFELIESPRPTQQVKAPSQASSPSVRRSLLSTASSGADRRVLQLRAEAARANALRVDAELKVAEFDLQAEHSVSLQSTPPPARGRQTPPPRLPGAGVDGVSEQSFYIGSQRSATAGAVIEESDDLDMMQSLLTQVEELKMRIATSADLAVCFQAASAAVVDRERKHAGSASAELQGARRCTATCSSAGVRDRDGG